MLDSMMISSVYQFGDLSELKPKDLRDWPEDKLLCLMGQNRGGAYDHWAQAESARRQNERTGQLIEILTTITDKVHYEIKSLASSSDRLEDLTKKLNALTKVLLAVTIVSVLVPIGIEIYHAHSDSRPTVTEKHPASRTTYFVESYDNGSISVRHEGKIYKATCVSGTSFYPPTDTNDLGVKSSTTCDLTVGLVGQEVQPFLDAKGGERLCNAVCMGVVGGAIFDQRYVNQAGKGFQLDRSDEFKITSVMDHH